MCILKSVAHNHCRDDGQTTQEIAIHNLFTEIYRGISPEVKAYLHTPSSIIQVEIFGASVVTILIVDSTGVVVEQVISNGSTYIECPTMKGLYSIIVKADSYYGVGQLNIE